MGPEAPPHVSVPSRMNATALLLDENVRQGRGERVALRSAGAAYTYREVQALANRAGNALRGLGVEGEQRVALLLPDGPDFVAAYFGAMKIGAVPVPLNTRLVPPEYAYLLHDSRARILVADASFLPALASIWKTLPHLRHVVAAGPPPDAAGPKVLRLADLLAAASPDLAAEEMSCDAAAYWLYSSGTTGPPKAAVHLHRGLLFCELYGQGILGVKPDDVTFAVSRLFFAYALGNNLHIPLRVGASALLYPEWPQPARILEFVRRERPTLFFSVPTFYARMLQEEAPPDTFASVRLCVSAGEALPAEIYTRWRDRFGVEILDGIGSTEHCYMFLSNRPGRSRPGSSGERIPGVEARLLDAEGRPVPSGGEGVLWVRSGSCCGGYWNQLLRTQETFVGGWFRTGDVYAEDGDGFFYNRGRADDMFKVAGMWVSPLEVEHALLAHPAVLEAAVVAAPGAEGLMKPRAFVVLRDPGAGSADMAQDLQRFVGERLAGYKCPRSIAFLAELPRTATGKVQRFKLRDGVAPHPPLG